MASSTLTPAQSVALTELVRAWRDSIAALAPPDQRFMGKPDAWFKDLHWFCANGHVSGVFLKSESEDRCLACHEPVLMGPAMSEEQFSSLVLPYLRSLCDGLHD